jgi:hypothetical protein
VLKKQLSDCTKYLEHKKQKDNIKGKIAKLKDSAKSK